MLLVNGFFSLENFYNFATSLALDLFCINSFFIMLVSFILTVLSSVLIIMVSQHKCSVPRTGRTGRCRVLSGHVPSALL